MQEENTTPVEGTEEEGTMPEAPAPETPSEGGDEGGSE